MNILVGILKYPPDYAGDGLRLHRTFLRLQKKNALQKVYVLTSWDRTLQKDEILDGISVHREVECTLKPKFGRFFKRAILPFKMLRVVFAYFKFFKKVDLVLTSGSGWLPSLIAWLAFFTNKPVIKEIVLLGSDDPVTIKSCKGLWHRWFFLAPFHFSKLIIAISPLLETACLAAGIPQEKIWCRLNPVDFGVLEKPSQNIPDPLPVILWVGTVTRRKNVLFLLESARRLKIPAKVWFVGPCDDKNYFAELEEARKKVPPYVDIQFLGQIPDRKELFQLYSRADLFWFASKKEGMGNVVAESLVCGTPVVTLPVMGIMEQVIPSPEDGEVVDTEDPQVFAEAASRWLAKTIDRKAIAQRAGERFDASRVDLQYIARLEKILQGNKPQNQLSDHPLLAPGRI